MPKPIILICYDYFYPGYKAGGPVQSLTNLIVALQHQYSFAVLTSAFDLMSQEAYQDVKSNRWNKINLPDVNESINIWYGGKGQPEWKSLKKLLKQLNPQIIYLNGIYSSRFFLLPLLVSKFSGVAKIVICPRGMLQSGALSVKSEKKKYYIKALQFSGLLKKATWHATNSEEAKDIKLYFPVQAATTVAYNIPKPPLANIFFPLKKQNGLMLVYLSLITEKKNLLFLLQALQLLPPIFQLDIYGPVKDTQYWQQCNELIIQMPDRVKYKGEIMPANVQGVLAGYHALCLLTKGENFGHALYESLSVGRPIITSQFTPWNDLWENKAGANVNITDIEHCKKKLMDLASFDQNEFNIFCDGAHRVALKYFKELQSIDSYKQLFS